MGDRSMRDRALPRTCLSASPHNDRVLDVTLHYFGCLSDSEKPIYFASLPAKSKRRIQAEKRRIGKLRGSFEAKPNSETGGILRRFKESLREYRWQHGRVDPFEGQSWPVGDGSEEGVDAEMKAAVIYFRDGRPYTVPGMASEFPNQKIPVRSLLEEDERNPLMKPCPDNMIRYFHLPANNMLWVEEVMARYYHEKRPEPDDFLVRSRMQDRTKTEMLLRSEFWQGQQHGDRNAEVHARHMRSLCDVVPTASAEMAPKNLVLFMHYLHWETDRARTRSAKVIKEASTIQPPSIAEIADQLRENERSERQSVEGRFQTSVSRSNTSPDKFQMPSPLQGKRKRRTPLGELLLWAANLSEAMDSQVDEKLVHEYLDKYPPLHPRRTLDQSFYGALKNTQARDRDQVVYRATTPTPHVCRKGPKGEACQDCQTDIRKVPRVIMVDQLWMWILDEKTIITSFPRRWGKNKPDPSAVHKSIRTRLRSAREDEIRSVFDLALIIVDQCSRVFFDRSKSIDRAPNLVDIFADAIRGVTYKQTAAFDQFLTYTHLASKDYGFRDKTGTTAMQNTLLNINPEGNLLKETKDILDEVHIMTRIKKQQQVVAEAFVKHIRSILLPKVAQTAHLQTAVPSEASLLSPGNGGREGLEAAKWTLARADALLKGMGERIAELNALEGAASNTSAALKDLLTLKQQQAGVIEAREAVKQATETLKQGRSIMLFTVVTIVFLPLSFFATVFGMNTFELNGSSMHLHTQFYYMFPISLAIILTSILLAFSSSSLFSSIFSLTLALLSYPFNIATTYIFTKSGLYSLSRDLESKAMALREKERKETGSMKAQVLREKMEEGGFQEMRRIVGDAEHELTEFGRGVGKLGKGAAGAGVKVGKGVWNLGKRGVSVDVESQGTGRSETGLCYGKPV